LTFEESLLITHMSSNLKEKIKLATDVNPLANDGSVRGVEEWLFDVQQTMKATLKLFFPPCVD
jgi:dynein heavy chain